jgi:hypothetical protein
MGNTSAQKSMIHGKNAAHGRVYKDIRNAFSLVSILGFAGLLVITSCPPKFRHKAPQSEQIMTAVVQSAPKKEPAKKHAVAESMFAQFYGCITKNQLAVFIAERRGDIPAGIPETKTYAIMGKDGRERFVWTMKFKYGLAHGVSFIGSTSFASIDANGKSRNGQVFDGIQKDWVLKE